MTPLSAAELDVTELGEPSWTACPSCGSLVYRKRVARNLGVCPECDHHMRVPVRERLAQLLDPDSLQPSRPGPRPEDPLHFADQRPYLRRLTEAQERTGTDEAALAGTATIGGHPLALAVLDFDFLGGSMGVEVGRRVAHAADLALRHRTPLLLVTASGGARMQEGVLSLVQMARTAHALARLREAGLPTICLLTDPTYGGVSASFAGLGDLVLAERGARIGFAGPRVVEQTIRQQLPPGFQTAEFLLAHGLLDRVENRADLRPLLIRVLALHEQANRQTVHDHGGGLVVPEPVAPMAPAAADAWDVVQRARDTARPTARDWFRTAFDDFVELHGDRALADDPAIVGGLASVGGRTVVVIGHQKGHTVKELVAAGFGMPHPEGYRKAMRLMDHAERFGLPVVTLVDTPGAHPGLEAEERGQSLAIAESILRLARLRVPVVSVVTGEGGSGGALALAAGDRLLLMENSYLSVISPEGCAAILWRDPSAAPRAARALHLLPHQLVALGVADGVVPEPPGGTPRDPRAAAAILRSTVASQLEALAGTDPGVLVAARSDRLAALDTVTAPDGLS